MDLRQGVVISNTNLVDTKKEVSFPWKGFSIVLFLTLATWGASFAFNNYEKGKVKQLQASLNSVKGNRDYKKIAFVADTESRLNSSKAVLEKRSNWDNFFQKLEQNTLPEVVFETMEAKQEDNSNQITINSATASEKTKYQITLKGRTVGLDVLARQVAAFKEGGDRAFATEVKVDNIGLKKTDSSSEEGVAQESSGSIEFTIIVTVNPSILETVLDEKTGTN